MIRFAFDEIIKQICCPECGGDVEYSKINNESGVILCKKCHSTYCIDEGIITILPKKYINKKTYQDFHSKHSAFLKKNKTLSDHFNKFIESLPKRVGRWEDDDVAFWDDEYQKENIRLKTNKLVARAYLRNKILFQPLRTSGLAGKKILEIGCGEAISAQKLLLPYRNDFLYIATDYSSQALKHLRKRLNGRKNTMYVRCLGDAVPFKDNIFDAIICLGVLHHMPKKENHISDLARKLKTSGLLLINEPYDRDYRLPRAIEKIIQKIIEPQQSAHEERINIHKFRENLLKEGLILNEYHCHTPVKTVLIRATGNLYLRSVTFVKFLVAIDKLIEKTLGRAWNLFSTGDCMVLFEKTK